MPCNQRWHSQHKTEGDIHNTNQRCHSCHKTEVTPTISNQNQRLHHKNKANIHSTKAKAKTMTQSHNIHALGHVNTSVWHNIHALGNVNTPAWHKSRKKTETRMQHVSLISQAGNLFPLRKPQTWLQRQLALGQSSNCRPLLHSWVIRTVWQSSVSEKTCAQHDSTQQTHWHCQGMHLVMCTGFYPRDALTLSGYVSVVYTWFYPTDTLILSGYVCHVHNMILPNKYTDTVRVCVCHVHNMPSNKKQTTKNQHLSVCHVHNMASPQMSVMCTTWHLPNKHINTVRVRQSVSQSLCCKVDIWSQHFHVSQQHLYSATLAHSNTCIQQHLKPNSYATSAVLW